MAAPSLRLPSWSRPLPLMAVGLLLCGAALAVSRGTDLPGFLPMTLLFSGTLLAGLAVQRQLRDETWLWPDRIQSSAVVSLAGLAGVIGTGAMRPEWVSGRMFYTFVFLLGLSGSLLILLPSLARRVVLSLWVLFHFTGMAVCVTSIDPPNNNGLFVSKQLWSYVYRPYLSFMYMTNAYHFYSPDPGHPELLWFAVCYDDDTYTWVKLPERANSPIGMHYQRMLALPAHSYGALSRLPLSAAELSLLPKDTPRPARGSWEAIYLRRQVGSTTEYRRQDEPKFLPIPNVNDLDLNTQYREPHDVSKKTLASVAHRIYLTAPPPRDDKGNVKPGVKVRSVKVYRVVHFVLSPKELADGVSPLDKTKHWPYFMGEFDADGNLVNDRDPFLYWYLPITVVPEGYPGRGSPTVNVRTPPKEGMLLDCLELHAAGPRRRPNEESK
ncbi:MAG: hypothetical protein U0797_11020 [Gemmataceae bacterium]